MHNYPLFQYINVREFIFLEYATNHIVQTNYFLNFFIQNYEYPPKIRFLHGLEDKIEGWGGGAKIAHPHTPYPYWLGLTKTGHIKGHFIRKYKSGFILQNLYKKSLSLNSQMNTSIVYHIFIYQGPPATNVAQLKKYLLINSQRNLRLSYIRGHQPPI